MLISISVSPARKGILIDWLKIPSTGAVLPIKYIKGDLLRAEVDIIAHGCNCKQTMAAGIAVPIVREFQQAESADRAFKPQKPEERLGLIDIVKVPGWNIRFVVNCYTQLGFGTGLQISYPAIRKCMEQLHDFALKNKYSVGIPKIGAGLGGGDWKKIEEIINDVFSDMEIKVYYLH